jgi:hypothetical protein
VLIVHKLYQKQTLNILEYRQKIVTYYRTQVLDLNAQHVRASHMPLPPCVLRHALEFLVDTDRFIWFLTVNNGVWLNVLETHSETAPDLQPTFHRALEFMQSERSPA